MPLLEVKLGEQTLHNLDPQAFHDLVPHQLRVVFTLKDFNHSGHVCDEAMQISIAVLSTYL